jgi:hypothetical protein
MSQILADAEMVKQIETADGPLNIVTDTGRVIAVVTPVKVPRPRPTREEIERRREEAKKHPERNKTTAEVLAEIRRRLGENP